MTYKQRREVCPEEIICNLEYELKSMNYVTKGQGGPGDGVTAKNPLSVTGEDQEGTVARVYNSSTLRGRGRGRKRANSSPAWKFSNLARCCLKVKRKTRL